LDARNPKKTILVIRTAPVAHCVQMVQFLRKNGCPDHETHWIWISQPSVEKDLLRACGGTDMEVLRYEDGSFTQGGLKKLCGERFRRERIDAAYVVFNNSEGAGYFQIIRFLSGLNILRMVGCAPVCRFEEIKPVKFVLRRISDTCRWILEWPLVLVAVPILLLYYSAMFLRSRLRRSPTG